MEIRIATVNIYIDVPESALDGLLSYLREQPVELPRDSACEEPTPTVEQVQQAARQAWDMQARFGENMEAIRQAERQTRYRQAGPIRTGPKPEPSESLRRTAHDLIMQMEGHDVDDDIQPDESWLDEWPDETASENTVNPYNTPL